jgi:hypothetical protein
VTAAERRKLSMLIVELAAGVLQARDDAEMKALYNEHGGTDYDAETEAADAELKAMLAGIFGVELGATWTCARPRPWRPSWKPRCAPGPRRRARTTTVRPPARRPGARRPASRPARRARPPKRRP